MSTVVASSSSSSFLRLILSLFLYFHKILHTPICELLPSSIYFVIPRHLFPSHSRSLCRLLFFSRTFANSHTYDRAHIFAQDSQINKHTRIEKISRLSRFPSMFLFVVDVAPFLRFEHFFGEVGVRLCHFLSFR